MLAGDGKSDGILPVARVQLVGTNEVTFSGRKVAVVQCTGAMYVGVFGGP